MKKQFVNFWEDYAEAQKACNNFNKKHWKGSLVLSSVIIGGITAGFYIKEALYCRKLYKQIESNEES
nr:MAG TPA: hypothetical protein [Caudoviricetes sp.]